VKSQQKERAMISMTIDMDGANGKLVRDFCQIPGMRDALRSLLYYNRRYPATVTIVNKGGKGTPSTIEDVMSALAEGHENAAAVTSARDWYEMEISDLSAQQGC
jgi:hypothetical protein